jgi:hypothetical protein
MAHKTINLATKYGSGSFVINGENTGIIRFSSIEVNRVAYHLSVHFEKGVRFEKGGPWKDIYNYFFMRRKDNSEYPSDSAKYKAYAIVNEILDENEILYAETFKEIGRQKEKEAIESKRYERIQLVKQIQALETEIDEMEQAFYKKHGTIPINELTTV